MEREWRWSSNISCLAPPTGQVMVMQDWQVSCICDICWKLRAVLSIEFGRSWKDKGKLTSSLKYIASAPPCWSVADCKRLRKQISSKLCSAFPLHYRRHQIWINKSLLLCVLLRFWMQATGRSNDYSGLWLLPISVAPSWGKGIEAARHNRHASTKHAV